MTPSDLLVITKANLKFVKEKHKDTVDKVNGILVECKKISERLRKVEVQNEHTGNDERSGENGADILV